MNSRLLAALFACLFCVGAITSVQASLLSYSISGTGSGSLDGTAFSNTDFTINLVGDPALFDGLDIDPLESATVIIDGLGTTELLISTRLGINNSAVVFFSRSSYSDLFDFSLAAPVDLTNPFGPVVGTDVFALQQFQDVNSSLGLLSFDSSSDVIFQATLIPMPAAVWLFGSGLLGLIGRARTKKAA